MELKKIYKINYKLGSGFILFPVQNGWTLLRSGSYRVVMSSDKNTEEELDKFVEDYREYDTLSIVRRYTLIANLIIFLLCIANLSIHSHDLAMFNFGAIIILLPLLFIIGCIYNQNKSTIAKIIDSDMAYYSRILCEEETPKKRRGRPTKAKGEKRSSEI